MCTLCTSRLPFCTLCMLCTSSMSLGLGWKPVDVHVVHVVSVVVHVVHVDHVGVHVVPT